MTSLCFVVESGTDVRLVEGLANRFDLSIIARRIDGGVEISQSSSCPVALNVGPASRLKFALFVWKYLRTHRGQFSQVMVQGYGLAALAANIAGRLNRTPTAMLVCSPIEAYYLCRRASEKNDKPFLRRELWALRAIARLNGLVGQRYFVLSEYLGSVVRRHRRRARVEVIPIYGVDTRVFVPPKESKHAIKVTLGLPPHGTLIFFSSRIAPEKDSETLLRAVRVLLDAGRDVWVLHRSGGHAAFLEEAATYGIAERVIATDAVHPHEALPRDYQAADMCVQASREEGLGFSPLEALACEVPVIAAAVGGLKETIIDGRTGWTYPVGDPLALAARIEDVIDNPAEASRRASEGRAMVASRYDSRVVFEKLEAAMGADARTELTNAVIESR